MLIGLGLIGAGIFYGQFSKELAASKHDASTPVSNPELPLGAVPGEDAAKVETQAVQQDPFKAFLEAKSKGSPSPATPTEGSNFVPGTDPFKAKLEEQKNAPHSAVSPFKN